MKKTIFSIVLILTTSACTDTAGFTSRLGDFEAAMNSGDVEGLVALYKEDAKLMPPNMPTMTGHDAVRELFGGMIADGVSVELESASYAVALNTAHRVGTYKTIIKGEVVDTGRFLETWNKDDGTWRMANDIWNSDRPAAPPPEPRRKHDKKKKGMEHTHVMIMHEVADGETWLNAWRGEESRHELFKANGAMHVHTFQHPENPNVTGLVVAVKDMAALEAMLASDEGQAAATEDGVDLENMSVLMEVK